MNKVDIEKIKNIKKDLESLNNDEVLYVEEDGTTKYVILTSSMFDLMEESLNLKDEGGVIENNVKIINADNIQLTYDEYENVKEQIIKAIDKTFKPKPEKLN